MTASRIMLDGAADDDVSMSVSMPVVRLDGPVYWTAVAGRIEGLSLRNVSRTAQHALVRACTHLHTTAAPVLVPGCL